MVSWLPLNKGTQFQTLKKIDMSTKDSKTEQPCTIHSVVPMLLSIAKCFDDYLEDLDPKDDTEEFSEAVEMMKNIVDDNSMFIRN